MRITILGGTGRMGSGLARAYVKAGHEVVLGSRSAKRAQSAAEAIKSGIPDAKVLGADLREAATHGELIVLSVPFADAADLVAFLADILEGKIIVDITNPFGAVPVGTATRNRQRLRTRRTAFSSFLRSRRSNVFTISTPAGTATRIYLPYYVVPVADEGERRLERAVSAARTTKTSTSKYHHHDCLASRSSAVT